MSAVAAPTTPFKGLAPFGDSELDALFFFGRARETEVIAANLQASRLTVLYGPSGVGKSSVLRAGVAQRLREEPDVTVAIVDSWSGDATAAIRDALAARTEESDLYLILDQFEEHFVYHADDAELPALLADVVAERGLRVNLLLGIRDDALARLDTFQRPIPNLLANRLRLDRLDRAEARAAILGPLERYNDLTGKGVVVEPELVEAVLDEVAAGRVELGRVGRGGVDGGEEAQGIEAPYLQLVLERLWDAEREAGSDRLRVETFRSLGGAARIVHDHLEHAMAGLTAEEKEAAAAMYDHLVTPSGTKVAHRVGDLAGYASVPESEATRVLAKLVDERILRASSHDGPAATRYEIFHDVLAEAVLAWRARHEEQRALRVAEERRRRAFRVATAALVGLLLVGAIAVYALAERSSARSQATRARARELTAKALAALDTDPASSVAYAAAAARLEPGLREENVLRQALTADRLRLTMHEPSGVRAVAYDYTGRLLMVAGGETIRLYPGRTLDQGTPVTAAALTLDGRFVVGGGNDGTVRVWSTATGRRVARLEARGRVASLAFARQGRLLVTAARSGTIRIWRRPGWRLVRTFNVRPLPLLRAEVDEGGTRVAVVPGRSVVPVYALSTGELLGRLAGKGFVGDAAFSPDGKMLATSDYVGHVRVWRASDLRLVRRLGGGQRNISDLEWSPDGTKLAGASADATARLWEIATGLQVAVMVHDDPVSSVAFDPFGDALATVSGATARIWGASPDKAGRPIAVLAGHTGPITAAVFDPDGRRIATGSLDSTARIWDPGSELELQRVVSQESPFTAIAASSTGQPRVVTGNEAGQVQAWTARGRQLIRPAPVGGPVRDVAAGPVGYRAVVAPDTAVAISPAGTAQAVARGRTVRLTHDGRTELRRFAASVALERDPIHELAFSADGRTLAVALEDDTVRLWTIGSDAAARVLRTHHQPIVAVAYSHDGRYVAGASLDGNAVVWSLRTGAVVRVLHGHFGPVRSVAFSGDDRWVLTAGPTTAGLWQSATGEHEFLRGPVDDLLTGAVWSGPDGWSVVTASRGGSLRVFHCALCGGVEDLLEVARRRLAAQR
jgi:WD40 repeat protein